MFYKLGMLWLPPDLLCSNDQSTVCEYRHPWHWRSKTFLKSALFIVFSCKARALISFKKKKITIIWCPHLLSVAVRNTMDKRSLERKGFIWLTIFWLSIIATVHFWWEARLEPKQRSWRDTAHWLAQGSNSATFLPGPHVGHTPRVNPLPAYTFVINQENAQQICLQTNLVEAFLSWASSSQMTVSN